MRVRTSNQQPYDHFLSALTNLTRELNDYSFFFRTANKVTTNIIALERKLVGGKLFAIYEHLKPNRQCHFQSCY